eukprot:2014940-Pyramimonas_sp.AAC.1
MGLSHGILRVQCSALSILIQPSRSEPHPTPRTPPLGPPPYPTFRISLTPSEPHISPFFGPPPHPTSRNGHRPSFASISRS